MQTLQLLELGRLGADHVAVAIEGVEVGGQLVRVGGEPVRRAPLGRLADLLGKLQQPLDQRALGGLEAQGETGQVGLLRP